MYFSTSQSVGPLKGSSPVLGVLMVLQRSQHCRHPGTFKHSWVIRGGGTLQHWGGLDPPSAGLPEALKYPLLHSEAHFWFLGKKWKCASEHKTGCFVALERQVEGWSRPPQCCRAPPNHPGMLKSPWVPVALRSLQCRQGTIQPPPLKQLTMVPKSNRTLGSCWCTGMKLKRGARVMGSVDQGS